MAVSAPTYPVTTIANLLKISERRVQQLTKEGIIPRAERGRYELAAAVQGYVSFLQDRVAGNPDATEGGVDYQAQRTRKVAAEASLAEIELAKARGEVVEIEIVRAEVVACFAACRARLLSIGSTLAPRMDLARTTAERQEMIDDAIHEAIHALAEGPALAEPSRADPDVSPDAEAGLEGGLEDVEQADPEPMG